MSTTMATKESVTRKWYILDAAGKPMGKTAALAADLLRGKLKTDYTPHVDCGDYVIIINAKDAVLTGNSSACASSPVPSTTTKLRSPKFGIAKRR